MALIVYTDIRGSYESYKQYFSSQMKFVQSCFLTIISTFSHFPKEQSQNIAIFLLTLITTIVKNVAVIYEATIMYKRLLGAFSNTVSYLNLIL